MTNESKRNLGMVALSCAIVLSAVIAGMQTNPLGLTNKSHVTNVTLEVKPIEEPSTVVLLDEVIISAEEKPSVWTKSPDAFGGPGAAMERKRPHPKPVEKPAKKHCYRQTLEQGGSPEHPFVTVCE